MDNFIVIPEWLAWCLLGALIFNNAALVASIFLAWRREERGRRRQWYPTTTDFV